MHVSSQTQAETAALAAQAQRATVTTAWVRLVGLAVFLPLLGTLHVLGTPGWTTFLLPTAGFTVVALGIWLSRAARWFARVGPYLSMLDALFVFELMRRSLPASPFPHVLATYTLSLMLLVIVVAAISMRTSAMWAVLIESLVLQFILMEQVGLERGPELASLATLVVGGLSQAGVFGRLQEMARGLASSEVDARLQQARLQAVEESRVTIERMLADARAQNDQLRHLQADKEALTSLLVHDLRAPLTAMRANLEWALDALPASTEPDIQDALGEARQVTDRLGQMIADLLNISRLEEGSMPLACAPFSSRDLLEAVLREVKAQVRNRNVTVEFDADESMLVGDHALLLRSLENLTSNALRYTPHGGRIRLEGRRAGAGVYFAVRNDGDSIPRELRASLFDKYVQAGEANHSRRVGWGLGLYFCRLCIDAHGGDIAVEDAEGWGTSFVVRLPPLGPSILSGGAPGPSLRA